VKSYWIAGKKGADDYRIKVVPGKGKRAGENTL